MNRYTRTIMCCRLTVLLLLACASPAVADGSIVSWGRDDYKQVTNTPAGTDFEAVAGGFAHGLAIATTLGTLFYGK